MVVGASGEMWKLVRDAIPSEGGRAAGLTPCAPRKRCTWLLFYFACVRIASDQLVQCKWVRCWGRNCARVVRVRTEILTPAHAAQRRVSMRCPTVTQRQHRALHGTLFYQHHVDS